MRRFLIFRKSVFSTKKAEKLRERGKKITDKKRKLVKEVKTVDSYHTKYKRLSFTFGRLIFSEFF